MSGPKKAGVLSGNTTAPAGPASQLLKLLELYVARAELSPNLLNLGLAEQMHSDNALSEFFCT